MTNKVKTNGRKIENCFNTNFLHQKSELCGLPFHALEHIEQFENFILQDGYPCIGAQASVHSKNYILGIFSNVSSKATHIQLLEGIYRYISEMTHKPSDYLTYVAVFEDDSFTTEIGFEHALWQLLQNLHTIDSKKYKWSEAVGKNPSKTDFSFSFGGKAFFLVGMHPVASRSARRYPVPAIAFNLHSQFENLRKKNRFQQIKSATRQRDINFQGSINPMLADYGEGLEAPQYSGRSVSSDWKCPFQPEN